MRKIFLILFLFFWFFFEVLAFESLKIITREEWWANESYMDKNWPEWTKIFEKREKNKKTPTKAELEAREKSRQKTKEINQILTTKFAAENEISSTDKYLNWRELIWPIDYSKKIRAIVVHHTHSDYSDSYDAIRRIYRYHALDKGWWDIGYNFLIWKNWEIFEWRAWWENAVWAHSLRNNRQTIGISLIWNYDSEPISDLQYESLQNLIKYLVKKHKIDLSIREPFNRNCNKDCSWPLETIYEYPIVWHRDTAHTTCPGQKLYEQLKKLRYDLSKENNSISFAKKEKYFQIFDKIWEKRLLSAMLKIEKLLESPDYKYNKQVIELKNYIIKYFEERQNYKTTDLTDKEIKVKLSYPEDKDFINIYDWLKEYKIEKIDQKLYVDWQEMENFSVENTINPYVEITSWDRTPVWDKEKRYKDNKFRWKIYIYLKDDKFVVVNILKMEDYLKWLGEISNSENKAKSEAIIISARTYALWYVEKDRKFPWEFYDASDDPDVFQKYLWYDLELRSPNINKVVEDTKWVVLKYNSEIIKPWYFSSSSWKTLSFYEYCIKNKNTQNFCDTEKQNYPFLQTKEDPGWLWKKQSWHWVGMSWTWATYFSSKWWTSSMILKYFYEWIEL